MPQTIDEIREDIHIKGIQSTTSCAKKIAAIPAASLVRLLDLVLHCRRGVPVADMLALMWLSQPMYWLLPTYATQSQ
jgi:hypothetical protein